MNYIKIFLIIFFSMDLNVLNTPLDSDIIPVNDFNFCSLLEVFFFFFCYGYSVLIGGLFDFK